MILELEKSGEVPTLLLDTKKLSIQSVELSDSTNSFTEGSFELGPSNPVIGTKLSIPILPTTNKVKISYTTDPTADALQWLPPSLTADKTHPYLLTQSQAINARSWVPIQDSPGIRFTYDATIQVPEGLMAVMSASNPVKPSEDGTYAFHMDQPIPAYLLALAVGKFEFQALGPRTGVYAEASMLEAAAFEFEEMEEMIKITESLYGPYAWERYDVIVLPPSFPFGGMENPRVTFATPTIIAGDRSLVSLIAHELAHSWSGNLVTNASWNDFWLNEGFTVYVELRIMEALKGKAYSEMLASLNFQGLEDEIAEMGPENRDTHLKLSLEGRNPDVGMTAIAYDKGYFFLRTLEEAVGREAWDPFLKAYFTEHAFQSLTTEDFLAYLDKNLLVDRPEAREKVNIREWVYGPGIPSGIARASAERFSGVEEALASIAEGKAPQRLNTENWSTHEWLKFIRDLPGNMDADHLASLDQVFNFTQSTNSEIQCAWYISSVERGYEKAYPAVEAFLINVGRRKFLSPLYKAILASDNGPEMARNIYSKARANYHPIARGTIDELLNWNEE